MTKEQNVTQQTAAQRTEEILKLRNGRKPMDGTRSRFGNLPRRAGFHTHWFNDEKGKVEQSLKDGWTFAERSRMTDSKADLVKNPKARISVRVGTKEDLSDLFAYAMDLPLEIYNGDRKEKLKSVDKKEAFMKGGGVTEGGGLDFKAVADIKTNQSNFQPD